jgi:hypothetical protein
MAFLKFALRREKKVKPDSPEIVEARRSLAELEELAKKDEIARRNLSARLTALQVELDNLTRRGGNIVAQ